MGLFSRAKVTGACNQSISQSINNRLIIIKADNMRNCDDKRIDS